MSVLSRLLPAGNWWESRRFTAAAILLSIIPLLWPAFPPLVDVPGHIGRYHIAMAIGHSAVLQRDWTYHWQLIGNLGVDLLVVPLTPLFGVVFATKLIVLMIPPLFVGGLIWLSYESDGRLSPAAPLAFPLAYGFAFQFGFINFVLAAALALNALALWVRLGRRDRIVLRTLLFVPISCLLWIAHSFGWGMFGLFAFAAECVRLRRRDAGWARTMVVAALLCVPLSLPIVAMALNGGSHGGLGVDYDWPAKAFWIATMLRERWKPYDVICVALLIAMLYTALRHRTIYRFDPLLGLLALVSLATFLALPRLLLGGAYVDTRMAGIALALALCAIRLCPDRSDTAATVANLSGGFFLIRTVTTTIAMLLFAQGQARALAVVDAIPRGAAVLVIVNEPCGVTWASDRLEHVDGIAIARRDIFDNGQWGIAGQQLVAPRHPEAEPYRVDPSQLAFPRSCNPDTTQLPAAIRGFNRGVFDYVWTMGFPSRPALAPDVRLIWSNNVSTLYQVVGRDRTVAVSPSGP